jgi:hypothetical protein
MAETNNTQRILNHITLMGSVVKEHYQEIFEEISLDNPSRAVEKFPEFLDKILSVGNGFFSGKMCGGPYPPATIPLFNTIGSVYPLLPKEIRSQALEKVMNFLNRQNYVLSQEYVEGIHEPWLCADIIADSRFLYWPGYKEYINRLEGKVVWSDLEGDLVKQNEEGSYLDVKSDFWFAFTVGRASTSEHIRNSLTEFCPDLVERTKDACATIIAVETARPVSKKESKNSFSQEAEIHLSHYAPEWHEDLVKKINGRNWVFFRDRHFPEIYDYFEQTKGNLIEDGNNN